MTEKRFTYDSKTVSILKDGEFWLDGNVDTACNHSEICQELNELAEENQELKLLLREVEHELTFLTGLSATDSTSIVKEDMEEYGLFKLDYTELLKKIDKVIVND